MKYRIIKHLNTIDLEREINELTFYDDWEPKGGLVFDGTFFYQVVIEKEKEPVHREGY